MVSQNACVFLEKEIFTFISFNQFFCLIFVKNKNFSNCGHKENWMGEKLKWELLQGMVFKKYQVYFCEVSQQGQRNYFHICSSLQALCKRQQCKWKNIKWENDNQEKN